MPAPLSYPGIYVEEVPSGVRPITGVSTSVAAFVGRAIRGPEDKPVSINNFTEFERTFGGLWKDSALGFAVRDFFRNGGRQAVIVRLYRPGASGTEPTTIAADTLNLNAASRGAWGNDLAVVIDHDVEASVAADQGLSAGDLFNLTLRLVKNGTTVDEEVHRNVSVVEGPRRVGEVLASRSNLMRAGSGADALTVIPAAGAYDALGVPDPATDGRELADTTYTDGDIAGKRGMYALEDTDIFNMLCLPPDWSGGGAYPVGLLSAAISYCETKRAILLIDPDPSLATAAALEGSALPTPSTNAAMYFPRLIQPNPLRENRLEDFAPCGAVAGVIARTDTQRGVWKAPAGMDATLLGVPELAVPLTDDENGRLNKLGVNCLRAFPVNGRVVWGARTRKGDDRLASEWKYLSVRRTSLFIQESLSRGLGWVTFEPNDEPLWSSIRLNVGAFMQGLFRQGAFAGSSPRDAYLVKCDSETTTQNDVNLGVVNIVVGFAPLKPAEFVIIKIQQLAGQVAT